VVDNLLPRLQLYSYNVSVYQKFSLALHTFFFGSLFPLLSSVFILLLSSTHTRTYMDTDTIQGTHPINTQDTQVHMAQLFQLVHGPPLCLSSFYIQPARPHSGFCFLHPSFSHISPLLSSHHTVLNTKATLSSLLVTFAAAAAAVAPPWPASVLSLHPPQSPLPVPVGHLASPLPLALALALVLVVVAAPRSPPTISQSQ
jgi:hypothetical protein